MLAGVFGSREEGRLQFVDVIRLFRHTGSWEVSVASWSIEFGSTLLLSEIILCFFVVG